AGFVPAGGTLAQRQNAGDIEAVGFELDAHWQFAPNATLDAGVLAVDAMVEGGSQAPQLTGKRPLQAPQWSVTGGVTVMPVDRLTVSFNLRYESARFVDDRNTITLPAATKFDARIGWTVAPMIVAYIAGENIFDAQIATTEGGGIVSHDAPRMIRAGLLFAR
ncbi:MAG: TonB-dependent receptor, partial [Proteobacteria bacterium]|nr:TonB-dependent receptor [Pseudomonadota bacterium]